MNVEIIFSLIVIIWHKLNMVPVPAIQGRLFTSMMTSLRMNDIMFVCLVQIVSKLDMFLTH